MLEPFGVSTVGGALNYCSMLDAFCASAGCSLISRSTTVPPLAPPPAVASSDPGPLMVTGLVPMVSLSFSLGFVFCSA